METNIISQIAQKVFEKNTHRMDPKSSSMSSKDVVYFSDIAQKVLSTKDIVERVQNEKHLQVEHLKAVVQDKQYHVDAVTAEKVAEKIVESLL